MVGIIRDRAWQDELEVQNPTIEEWVASKEPYRVTADGLSKPIDLPWRPLRGHKKLINLLNDEVGRLISSVMRIFNISTDVERVRVEYLHSPHDPMNGIDTVIIPTYDNEPTVSWGEAAIKIKRLFLIYGAGDIVDEFAVEIRNPTVMYCDVSMPLPNFPDLVQALLEVQPNVLETVSSLMDDVWTSIAYHWRVNYFDAPDYPNVQGSPTIIVFCKPGSRFPFKDVEDAILDLLKDTSVCINLEFLPGMISHPSPYRAKRLRADQITEQPMNGASISVADQPEQQGTLGGWFYLQSKTERVPCALTTYSVVRSSKRSIAGRTDAFGILPRDPYGHLAINYPSPADAKHTAGALLSKTDTDSIDAKNILRRRFVCPYIGKVFAASGHRWIKTPQGHCQRLNWALIITPDTFTANKPPPRSRFRKNDPPRNLSYMAEKDPEIQRISTFDDRDILCQSGRTSGATWGYVNPLRRNINWEGNHLSAEWEVIPSAQHFAALGDSGALVTNVKGELVGLLTAMDVGTMGFGSGFFTPIEDVMRDVEKLTGGRLCLAFRDT